MMHNITLNSNSSSWCVELPTRSNGGTTSFCNITEEWVPRITSEAVYIVPATLSVCFFILFIFIAIKKGYYKKSFLKDAFSWKCNCGKKKWLSQEEKREVYNYRIKTGDSSLPFEERKPLNSTINSIDDLNENETESLNNWRVENKGPKTEVVVGCDKCCGTTCCCTCCGTTCCCTCLTVDTGVQFTILLSHVTIIFDIYDVYTDCEYHYKYENFGQVHQGIYRNGAVSIGILVFAIFGMVKVIVTAFYFIIIRHLGDYGDHPDNESRLIKYFKKVDNKAIVFIVEDCAENFLGYFYIEKYLVGDEALSSTMILKILINSIRYGIKSCKGLMEFYKGCKALKKKKKDLEKEEQDGSKYLEPKRQSLLLVVLKLFTLPFPMLFICFGNFLRLFGAFYQNHYGKLDDHCVAAVNGRLIQTPFTSYPGNCMRIWEYIFMVCNFVPLLFYIVGLALFIRYIRNSDKAEFEKFEMQRPRQEFWRSGNPDLVLGDSKTD
ncbi:uncharacterized protein [Clytia hemisphaerica]|uniref:Uncharacterized protein n=1 Tax=Clytia hemisphaerica TaxID=252671 RepID=A0A7M5WX72_9CNID